MVRLFNAEDRRGVALQGGLFFQTTSSSEQWLKGVNLPLNKFKKKYDQYEFYVSECAWVLEVPVCRFLRLHCDYSWS